MSTIKSNNEDFTINADGANSEVIFQHNGTTIGTPNTFAGHRKNLIINGAMEIAQRGTSATGIGNNDIGYHTLDRWSFYEAGAATGEVTMAQVTDAPANTEFNNSMKFTVTTADTLATDEFFRVEQYIEAQYLQHLLYGTSDAKDMTLSFWVKSDTTGIYGVSIYRPDNSRTMSASYTIDAADTWEYKTVSIPGDTVGVINNDTGTGISLAFWMDAGDTFTSGPAAWAAHSSSNYCPSGQAALLAAVSNYINITGVQLEVGNTATEYERRPFGEEEMLCYRYYWELPNNYNLGRAYNTTYVMGSGSVQFPCIMRTTASCSGTFSAASGSNGTFNANAQRTSHMTCNNSANNWTTDTTITLATLTADAELTLVT